MNHQREPLLEMIRARPSLYLGEASLTALFHFIGGFELAVRLYDVKEDSQTIDIPREFHDWVAYRLHFEESTSGWRRMILSRTTSEAEGFARFFELWDDFQSRTPNVVARLIGHQKEFTRTCEGVTTRCKYPESISLVTYTDDPGFFAYSDDANEFPHQGFFPSIDYFELLIDADRSALALVDPTWKFGE